MCGPCHQLTCGPVPTCRRADPRCVVTLRFFEPTYPLLSFLPMSGPPPRRTQFIGMLKELTNCTGPSSLPAPRVCRAVFIPPCALRVQGDGRLGR